MVIKRRCVLVWKKIISFSLIRRQQKLTRTVTFISYCLNVIDIIRSMTLNSCMQDSVPSHRAKVTQHFLRQNTPDFIAADELASYYPDRNPLDYCIWDTPNPAGYPKCNTLKD